MLNVSIKTEVLIIQAGGREVGSSLFCFLLEGRGEHGLRLLGTKNKLCLWPCKLFQ